LLFVVSIPLYVSFRIGIGAIRGRENTRYKIIAQNIGYPGLRLVFVTSLLMLNVGLVATGLGYLTALVVATILTYLLLNRILPLWGEFRLHGREMVVFSAPLIVSTIMSTLLTHTDTLMLGYFRPSSEVGIYSAAYPVARGLTLVLGAFGYMYLPVASRLDSKEGESVERVYEVTTKWMYLLVFPLFVTLLVYPEPIITMIFGREYVTGGAALGILAIGFFTTAAVGRNRETLSALGATKFILVSNLIAFGFNFLLNLALIPRYGFMGAAAASASSIVILNLVVYLFLKIRFGITPFNGRSMRAFVALPVVLVPLGFVIRGFVPDSPAAVVVFGITFTVLTVVIASVVGSLEPEDVIVVQFVEDRANVRIPFVRWYIPDE
jgi:O-antigen/teichoic acid export membrane protein